MGNQQKKQPVKATAGNVKKKKVDKSAIIIGVVGGVILVAIILAIVLPIVLQPDPSDKEVKKDSVTSNAAGSTVDMVAVANEINSKKIADFEETDEVTEYVKITVKGHGNIIVRLRSDIAPLSVKNFQELVAQDFYNGLTFHRIIQNFMIQGGQNASVRLPTIKGEFSANGVTNDLLHLRGVISMARTPDNDSATSQFFICDKKSDHLNGNYAAFGYVVAGLATVDSVAAVTTNSNDAPLSNVIIEKVCFVTAK